MSTKNVTPYASSNSKNQQVREMFNRISNRYDSLNSILSLGVHRYWRKACLNEIKKKTTQPKFILDVATGTGDFALTCLNLNPEKITGMDITFVTTAQTNEEAYELLKELGMPFKNAKKDNN